jgi:hypothetical protein
MGIGMLCLSPEARERMTPSAHAHDLADLAAQQLRARGREVLRRGRSTLVTWREPEADRQWERLLERGEVVRTLAGEDLLRASFGGWSRAEDLERLLDALPQLRHGGGPGAVAVASLRAPALNDPTPKLREAVMSVHSLPCATYHPVPFRRWQWVLRCLHVQSTSHHRYSA